MTTISEYGPFSVMFEPGDLKVPAYLELLNLGFPDSALVALRRLRGAVDGAEALQPHLELLLSGFNWRPHLVGAVASLMVPDPSPVVPCLWRTVDTGSWVIPQICTALSFLDPSFIETARNRVIVGTERPNAKATASLIGLLRLDSSEAEWAGEAETRPEVRDLLDRDRAWDNSDRIVERWRAGLLGIVREEPQLIPRLGAT